MIPQKLHRVDRRLLTVGAGLVGVLLGMVLVVTVFGEDGGNAAPVTPRRPTPTPVAVAEGTSPATLSPVEAAATLPSRDPFRQLVSVPTAPSSGQAPRADAAPSRAPTIAAPSTTPTGDANTTASLELKSIVKDSAGITRANITVDGKSYSPAAGEVFSYGYRLERIDGRCVEVSGHGGRAQMCTPPATP